MTASGELNWPSVACLSSMWPQLLTTRWRLKNFTLRKLLEANRRKTDRKQENCWRTQKFYARRIRSPYWNHWATENFWIILVYYFRNDFLIENHYSDE
jgi:hypothetical protein